MAIVKIGCKLPHGLVLEVNNVKVALNGANQHFTFMNRMGDVGVTDVEQSFWNEWLKSHAEAAYVINGFVFETKDEASASAKAKDTTQTGLEPLNPDSNGVTTEKHTNCLARRLSI